MFRACTAALTLSLLSSLSAAAADRTARLPTAALDVTVSVFNDAHIPEPVLARGEQMAARVFQESGVKVGWANCGQSKLTPAEKALCQLPQLSLRIVTHASGMATDAFGAAFLDANGFGRYSDVFFDRIERLHRSDPQTVDIADLLGCVAAHEIGHLLGLRVHARVGIMRARWEHEELQSVAMGNLLFTTDESQQLRARLASVMPPIPADVLAAASP